MEHVRLSSDFVDDLPTVPYLCTEEYEETRFHGMLGFSYYYSSKGWTKEELHCRKAWDANYRCDDANCHVHRCSCQRPHSIPDNTSFLQTWLFFGLLKMFLGQHFRSADFIRLDGDSQQVLTTARLPAILGEWATEFMTLDANTRNATETYIEYSLTNAREIYLHICQSSTIPPNTLLSIGLLGEALVGAARAHTAITDTEFDVWKHSTKLEINTVTNLLRVHMLDRGWCPADIERLGWFDLTGVWYISNLSSFRGGATHQECTRSTCKHLQEYLRENYVTRHVRPECNCRSVAVQESRLQSILNRRLVPLLIPAANDEYPSDSIGIIESGTERKYVAISHVWADGLGNPGSNSLPVCQHTKLSELVKSLYSEPHGEIYYWIDTLACPVEPESKKLALKLMGTTYKDADKVLVLDSSLMTLKHGEMDETEITIRIYLSAWIRRLWTYQEGVFAKKLYFQFADGPWEFDSATGTIMSNALLGDRGGAGLMLAMHHTQIRDLRVQGLGDYLVKLPIVTSALRGRSTSKASDEAICLASLCDVDLGNIVSVDDADERMQAFWSSMSRVPRQLIFWPDNCLTNRGYRWAPNTFLDSEGPVTGIQDENTDEQLATITPEGLLFRSPGLYLGPMTGTMPKCLWLRDTTARLEFPFFLVTHYPEPLPPNIGIVLVTNEPITATTRIWDPNPVILVALTRVQDDVAYGTTLTLGLLGSRDGSRTSVVINEADRIFADLVHQITIFAHLNVINDGLVGDAGAAQAFLDVDVSQLRVDGMHAGFNLDLLPGTQPWCVERDVAWRRPLAHDR